MTYVVVGAGAIGGSLAAMMADHGLDVTVIDASREHVEAMNRDGLRVTGQGLDVRARVAAFTPDQVDFPLDKVLLSVKSQDTGAAMETIAPRLSGSGFVVSLQNGLNEYEIARRVGADRVVGALVNWAADYIAPGEIRYGGASNFVIGEWNGAISTRVQRLVAELPPQTRAVASTNVLGFLWAKQISITVLFATGITPLTMSDCLETVRFQPLFGALAAEGIALADEYGVHLEELDDFKPELYRRGDTAHALEITARHYRPMLKQHSGLYRDLAVRRRKSEAEGTVGTAIRLGELRGHAMAAHRAVLEMVEEIERGTRPISADNLADLAGTWCGR